MTVIRGGLATVLMACPVLAPWAWGPSGVALQALVSLACCGGLLLLVLPQTQRFSRAVWVVMLLALLSAVSLALRAPAALLFMGLVVLSAMALVSASASATTFTLIPPTPGLSQAGSASISPPPSQPQLPRPQTWLSPTPLLAGIVLAAMLSAIGGLMQFFQIAHHLGSWLHPGGPDQVFANLRQRNQLATVLSLGLAIVLFSLARLDIWRNKQLNAQSNTPQALEPQNSEQPNAQAPRYFALALGLGLFALALMTSTLAATSSRTGFLQLVLVVLAAFWLAPPASWARRAALALLPWYFLSSVLLPWLAGLPLDSQANAFTRFGVSTGCLSRTVLWDNALHLISLKPWLGWGWGEMIYAHFMTLYPGERFCDLVDNAHNLPLQLAVELGIPATVLVLGGFGYWVWRQRPWACPRDGWQRLAWFMLTLIGLHSMLEYPLWHGPFLIMAGVALGLVALRPKAPTAPVIPTAVATPLAAGASTAPGTGTQAGLAQYLALALLGLSLIVFAAAAAFDYHRVSQPFMDKKNRHSAYVDDALGAAQQAWLFRQQAWFAEVVMAPVNEETAKRQFALAQELLHYSPEPRVVERLIESALLINMPEEALLYMPRYRAAHPKEFAIWLERQKEKTRQARVGNPSQPQPQPQPHSSVLPEPKSPQPLTPAQPAPTLR